MNELESNWKENVVTQSSHMPAETQKNHENPFRISTDAAETGLPYILLQVRSRYTNLLAKIMRSAHQTDNYCKTTVTSLHFQHTILYCDSAFPVCSTKPLLSLSLQIPGRMVQIAGTELNVAHIQIVFLHAK